jgi:hypothetical protein
MLGIPRGTRSVFLPHLMGTIAVTCIVVYAVTRQPSGSEWNYYPAKLAWLWILAGLPMLLIPAAYAVPAFVGGRLRREAVDASFRVTSSVVVLALAAVMVRVSSPLLPPALALVGGGGHVFGNAWSIPAGWGQPDARMVRFVLDLAREDRSWVIWSYSDPGHDRLGNFWLSTLDPLPAPGQGPRVDAFGGWAYTYDPTDIAALCSLLASKPGRTVATADPALLGIVRTSCGASAAIVRVFPNGGG